MINSELLADIRHELVTMNILIASYLRYVAVTGAIATDAPGSSERTMVLLQEAADHLLGDLDLAMGEEDDRALE